MTKLSEEDIEALGGKDAAENRRSYLVALLEQNGGALKDVALGRALGHSPDLEKIILIPGYGAPAFQFDHADRPAHETLRPRTTPVAYTLWWLQILKPYISGGGGSAEEEQ
jgi:hypothetical protein